MVVNTFMPSSYAFNPNLLIISARIFSAIYSASTVIFGPKLSPVTISSLAAFMSASLINCLATILLRIKSLLFLDAIGFLTGLTEEGLCKIPANKADSAIEASEKSFPK